MVPDGAFYIYADCSALDADADRLTREMLQQAGVVMVPGLDFGPSTEHRYVRISYATSMEKLQEAMARLKVFFTERQISAGGG